MENKISVIVLTFNQEDTIGRTLDSILMQRCHVPYEIVIGEDCSTDGTLDICRQYEQKHPDIIRLFANKENKGVVDNYFDCIMESRGQYIADCAGDDFWTDPLKLEKEVSILENNPNVTLVHTNWESYNEQDKSSHASPDKPFTAPITQGYQMIEAIITQRKVPVIQLCTSLYRSSIILKALSEEEKSFRDKSFGCEDLQVAALMAAHGDIAYITDVTLNYSERRETVSYSLDHHKQFCFVKRITYQSFLIAQHYHINSPATDRFFSQRVFELGMFAFRAHDRQMLAETFQCEKDWRATRATKTRWLFTVMRHEVLWRTGLIVRQVFVKIKQLHRQLV